MEVADHDYRPIPDEGEPGLYDDLRATLRELPHGHDAEYRAGAVLVKHYADLELLGLIDEGQQAVYYSALTRCVAAVPFDATRARLEDARPLAQTIDDPESWLRVSDHHWNWLHPRYR